MSGEPMALRPHHGMCMAYLVGFGYSDGFSRNRARLLAAELTPDRPVRLTVDTDQVCAACPRSAGGRCDKPELVAGYDRAVLELCGLTEGAVLAFGAFTALVQSRILDRDLRRFICGGCQWDGLCSRQPSRWAASTYRRPLFDAGPPSRSSGREGGPVFSLFSICIPAG